ncbi:MAG: M20 family metallopeptidase [Pseudomonadota bacterium]
MKPIDPIELCSRLVGFDTTNPPGNEMACARYLGGVLSDGGFEVTEHSFGPERVNLVARVGSRNADRSLCFVGHLDTVPVGAMPWRHPPFSATIEDGRLHGRGSCDMKGGVAAFVTAALRAAGELPPGTSLTLILAGGEETGCEGSSHLARSSVDLSGFDGVIIAEPTGNEALLGHKGALWIRARARGVAAHGAMPHNGVNAAVKAGRMILALQDFCAGLAPHPVLGEPTINIGKVRAGNAVNVVPDFAEIDIDLRTTPGLDHDMLRQRMLDLLAPDIDEAETLVSMSSVFTDPGTPWVNDVLQIVAQETGRAAVPGTASYFTDASALDSAFKGAPILILGPGSPRLMHQTDEYCEVSQILEAQRIYSRLIAKTLAHPEAERADIVEQA